LQLVLFLALWGGLKLGRRSGLIALARSPGARMPKRTPIPATRALSNPFHHMQQYRAQSRPGYTQGTTNPDPTSLIMTENLALEHLRAMRGDIGDIKGRLDRMDLRLSAIEQTIGSLYALSAGDRETLHGVIKRVERIERRLDLSEA
jgi:hypothetical protein